MSFPERIRYGAAELRRFYNRNLFMALGVSIALHLGLIALYLGNTGEGQARFDETPIDPTVTEIKPLERPIENDIPIDRPAAPAVPDAPAAPAAPSDVPAKIGTPALAGDYQPVDDNLLKPDQGNVANVEDVASSTPNGKGNGGDPNGVKNGGPTVPQGGGGGGEKKPDVKPADEIPNEFPDPDVELPDIDLAELSSRAEYPRMARENGIEGKVTVKVLIGEDGRPLRTSIEQSASPVLDSAAIRAVRSTVFKPATLNGTPVRAWLFLPINFTLE